MSTPSGPFKRWSNGQDLTQSELRGLPILASLVEDDRRLDLAFESESEYASWASTHPWREHLLQMRSKEQRLQEMSAQEARQEYQETSPQRQALDQRLAALARERGQDFVRFRSADLLPALTSGSGLADDMTPMNIGSLVQLFDSRGQLNCWNDVPDLRADGWDKRATSCEVITLQPGPALGTLCSDYQFKGQRYRLVAFPAAHFDLNLVGWANLTSSVADSVLLV